MKMGGNKVILYHMGDENGVVDISGYANFDLVIRNYFFSKMFESSSDRISWAPLGFKTGVGPRSPEKIKGAVDRQILASFLGLLNNVNSYNNERAIFSESVAQCGENLFLMSSDSFGGGANPGMYSAVMEDSIFSPCPAGNSPETIRLYDGLELGCIPITLRHEFLLSPHALGSLGEPPFIYINSWLEMGEILNHLREKLKVSPNEIMAQQSQCIEWWGKYKNFISNKIASKISKL